MQRKALLAVAVLAVVGLAWVVFFPSSPSQPITVRLVKSVPDGNCISESVINEHAAKGRDLVQAGRSVDQWG